MTLEMVVLFLVTALVTWIITFFTQVRPAYTRAASAEKDLAAANARIREQKNAEAHVKEIFSSLAPEALRQNSKDLLQLLSERYKRHSKDAKNDLYNRQEAIKTLVSPISKSLSEFASKVGEINKDYGSVKDQISSMNEITNRLVRALQRPEGRGAWGELQFRNVVEMAGMAEHIDFEEQSTVYGKEDKSRPDAIIHLPNDRLLVVDTKTPIDSYLEASKASNEDERKVYMKNYVNNFRKSIDDLSHKSYWDKLQDKLKRVPDFVVMFVPGEAFFSAALTSDPKLIQYGVEKKVVIASPTTLIALLKTVAYCWQQHKFTENVEEVSKQAKKLFESIKIFGEHMSGLRKTLENSVKKFNDSIGSLERNVLPKARRFVDLGVIPAKEEIMEIPSIEEHTREISAPELLPTKPGSNVED